MTRKMCEELYKNSPHEVAVHAYTHPFLERLPSAQVVYEIIKDREELEATFGGIVRGMAYPYGAYSDEVVKVLETCGIVYARTTKSTERFDVPTDWLRMPATCHHLHPRLMELAHRFVEDTDKRPKLFYLWGHSYSFNDNDNWDVIERFCEHMGGRDDVWYATNIEIYRYTEAFDRLEFSADGSMVYNPSNIDVYIGYYFNEYLVPAGSTVKIEPKR